MTWRFRQSRANVALFVAATVFALLVVETALRVTGHHMVFPQMFIEDPHTVYRLKPTVRARAIHAGYFDYEYTVNSQGFRAAGAIGPKSSQGKRILFVAIRSRSASVSMIRRRIRRESQKN